MQLIYFSPVPHRSYKQRPHYFIEFFLAQGIDQVIWVEPYPHRLPRIADLWRVRPISHLYKRIPDPPSQIKTVSTIALPLEPLAIGRLLNRRLFFDSIHKELIAAVKREKKTAIVIGKPSSLALEFVASQPSLPMIYDAMDDFPKFSSGIASRFMEKSETAVADRADTLIVSSSSLADKFEQRGLCPKKIFNAAGINDFPKPTIQTEPTCTLGYVGAIGLWFDWEAVIRLARIHSNHRIRLIGPQLKPPPIRLPANISLEGEMPNSDALIAMKSFDAGLIPFLVNELTESIDPIKYYDYRSMGLSVISTRFGEMKRRNESDYVYFFDADYSAALNTKPSLSETVTFRNSNNWATRFLHSGLNVEDLFRKQNRSVPPKKPV